MLLLSIPKAQEVMIWVLLVPFLIRYFPFKTCTTVNLAIFSLLKKQSREVTWSCINDNGWKHQNFDILPKTLCESLGTLILSNIDSVLLFYMGVVVESWSLKYEAYIAIDHIRQFGSSPSHHNLHVLTKPQNTPQPWRPQCPYFR
jgi:hypothetical protein